MANDSSRRRSECTSIKYARQIQRSGVDRLFTKWTLDNELMSYLQTHPAPLLQRLRCTLQGKMEMATRSSQGDGREVCVLSWAHEESFFHGTCQHKMSGMETRTSSASFSIHVRDPTNHTRGGNRDFVGNAESHDPTIRTLQCFQEALCIGQCRRLLIHGT